MAHVAVHRICKLEVILILILKNAHISLAKYEMAFLLLKFLLH